MRKSIATVSLSGPLAGKLTAIAEAGFDGVEIFENDLLSSRSATSRPCRPASSPATCAAPSTSSR